MENHLSNLQTANEIATAKAKADAEAKAAKDKALVGTIGNVLSTGVSMIPGIGTFAGPALGMATNIITSTMRNGGYALKYRKMGGLTVFDGPTHEDGGLALGDVEVEGGETMHKDFVYTNSAKVSKQAASTFSLPKRLIGKSYAEASKILEKEASSKPNDTVAQETYEKMMDRLQKAHLEDVPMSRPEVQQALQQYYPTMKYGGSFKELNGKFVPNIKMDFAGMPLVNLTDENQKMAYGGPRGKDELNLPQGPELPDPLGMPQPGDPPKVPLQTVDALNRLANTEPQNLELLNSVAGIDKRLEKNQAKLSNNDPVVSQIQPSTQQQTTPTPGASSNPSNATPPPAGGTNPDASGGGPNNKKTSTGSRDPLETFNVDPKGIPGIPGYSPPKMKTIGEIGANDSEEVKAYQAKLQEEAKANGVDTSDPSWLSYLRYAPVGASIANVIQTFLEKPEEIDFKDYMSERKFTPRDIDRNLVRNQLREQRATAIKQIQESGADAGQIAAALASLNYASGQAMSGAEVSMQQAYNQQLNQADMVDINQEQFNNQLKLNIRDMNDRNRGAHLSDQADQLAMLSQNLGNVGREELYKDLIEQGSAYDWFGRYVNPDMAPVSMYELMAAQYAQASKAAAAKQNKD